MSQKTLQQLLAALPGCRAELNGVDPGRVEIGGITKDSRKVQPGHLFVAYAGIENDLHCFIPDAVGRGAAAVVCENDAWNGSGGVSQPVPRIIVPNGRLAFALLCAEWQDHPSRSLVLVGVTGTDGKTTTSNLIFSMLGAAGLKSGIISTVNAVIGERVLDTGLHTTTPDADEVQSYLAQMRDAGATHGVLEVTSHGLAQYRVDACAFDVAVVTNITHEHLDLHGSREAYRAAKARLFEMAPAAVLNADDAYSFEFLLAIPVERRIVYSLGGAPAPHGAIEVRAGRIQHQPGGMSVAVRTPRGEMEVTTTLVGEYNASNILAAAGVATALDLPAESIQAGVAAMKGVPGRMERIDLGQPFTAIVDFAHTPNALDQCLRTLRPMTRGRLIAVFGCAGERDKLKRPLMGRIAAAYADEVVLTAEDPRREPLEAILDDIQAGAASPRGRVHRRPDRGEAIQFACELAAPGDVVVSCGKGHEQSMCFGTTETPWDDREAMRAAIRAAMIPGA